MCALQIEFSRKERCLVVRKNETGKVFGILKGIFLPRIIVITKSTFV